MTKGHIKRGLALGALLIALAILASLGTWQARRFLERRDIFTRMEAHLGLDVLPVDSAGDFSAATEFRKVRLEGGRLDIDRTALLPRRFHKHLAGAFVLAPYTFADGSVVLVQRGWIPEGRPKTALTPPDATPLVGLVYLPSEVEADLARDEVAAGTFDLSSLPELGALDGDLLYDVLQAPRPTPGFVVVLGPEYAAATSLEYPEPTDEHITSPYLTPMTHFGYAFLWYGSALLLVWLFWAGWTGRLSPARRHGRD